MELMRTAMENISAIFSSKTTAVSERTHMNTLKLVVAHYLLLGRSRMVLLGTLCAIGLWVFAPGAAFSQSSVQRDEQALTILAQTIEAGGGSKLLASIQDITETGKITYHGANSNDIRGNVTVKGRGLHQLKIEADLSTGQRTTVVNGHGGSVIEADGRRAPLHGQSAEDLGSLTIPYLPLIAAMQDPSISIVYGGLVNHNDASAYNIRLQRVYTKQQDPHGDRARRETRDVYIDPRTFLIAAVVDQFYLAGPKQHSLAHEDRYSGYQTNNGVMMPLAVSQTIGGEIGFTMNLEQVTINAKLTDADFN
jgi:hypothetical protein